MTNKVLESIRARLLTLERLVLQSVSFDFQLRAQQTITFAIKFARKWNGASLLTASPEVAHLAWRVACDTHRSYAPLIYPPHCLGVASVYLAAILARSTQATDLLSRVFGGGLTWERDLLVSRNDVDGVFVLTEIAHYTLDVYLLYASRINITPNTSISSPEIADPTPLALLAWAHSQERPKDPIDVLTQIKIQLRQREATRDNKTSEHVLAEITRMSQISELPVFLQGDSHSMSRKAATRYVF